MIRLILEWQLIKSSAPLTLYQQSPFVKLLSQTLSEHLRNHFQSRSFIMPQKPLKHSKNDPFCNSRFQSTEEYCMNQRRFKLKDKHPMHFWLYHS